MFPVKVCPKKMMLTWHFFYKFRSIKYEEIVKNSKWRIAIDEEIKSIEKKSDLALSISTAKKIRVNRFIKLS